MLMPAPRSSIENMRVPSLGGIPLVAKLGHGGMGAVYLGLDPKSGGEVAVKVLPFHMADRDPVLIERFFREAKMSMQIQSPNLVRVSNAAEENGLCFIVMEFVSGVSAGGYLKKNKGARLAEAEALDICIAATQGLLAAHKAGIIHRDIKPDNILLPKDDAVPGKFRLLDAKLADLGLARTEEHGNSLTQSQTAMGTPGYLAPEQAMDARKSGKPADVFSMGATLYAMLTGRPPFHAKAPLEIIMQTVNQPHEPLPSLRPEVSAATVALVDRCLMKESQHRFRDAESLLTGLKLCREVLTHPERQARAVEQLRGSQLHAQEKPKLQQPYFDELTMQAPTPLRRPELEADAGIARLRADEQRKNVLPLVAALVLAGFMGAGIAMLVLTPTSAEKKPAAAPVPPLVVTVPVSPAAAPAPVVPEGPAGTGDKRFQDLQQQQLDRITKVGDSLTKVQKKVDQAKVLEPMMPISSVQDEEPGETFFSAGRVMFSFLVSTLGLAYVLYSRKSKGMAFGVCGAILMLQGWFIPWLAVGVMLAGVLLALPLFLEKR